MAKAPTTDTPADQAPAEPSKPRCGIVRPISAMPGYSEHHWREVHEIIKEALTDTFDVALVSEDAAIGVIQSRIVRNLYDCDMIIAVVSGQNANVMLELGMRLAFDKPVIIMKDEETPISFDFSPLEVIFYPHGLHYQSIVKLKIDLANKAKATLDASKQPGWHSFLHHFGDRKVVKLGNREIGSPEAILEEITALRIQIREIQRAPANLGLRRWGPFTERAIEGLPLNSRDQEMQEAVSLGKLILESDMGRDLSSPLASREQLLNQVVFYFGATRDQAERALSLITS